MASATPTWQVKKWTYEVWFEDEAQTTLASLVTTTVSNGISERTVQTLSDGLSEEDYAAISPAVQSQTVADALNGV